MHVIPPRADAIEEEATVWIVSENRRTEGRSGDRGDEGAQLRRGQRTPLRIDHGSATIVAMSTESLRHVRDHLSEVVDRVEHEHERVTLTRNGRPAAVLISPEDLAQLEETLEVLGDPDALAEIREADAAYARGEVVRGVDAVRALRR
jgi:antitoxin YefM